MLILRHSFRTRFGTFRTQITHTSIVGVGGVVIGSDGGRLKCKRRAGGKHVNQFEVLVRNLDACTRRAPTLSTPPSLSLPFSLDFGWSVQVALSPDGFALAANAAPSHCKLTD